MWYFNTTNLNFLIGEVTNFSVKIISFEKLGYKYIGWCKLFSILPFVFFKYLDRNCFFFNYVSGLNYELYGKWNSLKSFYFPIFWRNNEENISLFFFFFRFYFFFKKYNYFRYIYIYSLYNNYKLFNYNKFILIFLNFNLLKIQKFNNLFERYVFFIQRKYIQMFYQIKLYSLFVYKLFYYYFLYYKRLILIFLNYLYKYITKFVKKRVFLVYIKKLKKLLLSIQLYYNRYKLYKTKFKLIRRNFKYVKMYKTKFINRLYFYFLNQSLNNLYYKNYLINEKKKKINFSFCNFLTKKIFNLKVNFLKKKKKILFRKQFIKQFFDNNLYYYKISFFYNRIFFNYLFFNKQFYKNIFYIKNMWYFSVCFLNYFQFRFLNKMLLKKKQIFNIINYSFYDVYRIFFFKKNKKLFFNKLLKKNRKKKEKCHN